MLLKRWHAHWFVMLKMNVCSVSNSKREMFKSCVDYVFMCYHPKYELLQARLSLITPVHFLLIANRFGQLCPNMFFKKK